MQSAPIEQRFFAKVLKTESCWNWQATKVPRGYGILGRGRGSRKYIYAHRFSYQYHVGEIPEGISVLHKCDNPSCVNPKHLFLGTQLENMKDMRKKNRGTVGVRHPNAILNPEIVCNIRKEYAAGGTSLSILGRKYDITFQHVHDIIKNKIWREV